MKINMTDKEKGYLERAIIFGRVRVVPVGCSKDNMVAYYKVYYISYTQSGAAYIEKLTPTSVGLSHKRNDPETFAVKGCGYNRATALFENICCAVLDNTVPEAYKFSLG